MNVKESDIDERDPVETDTDLTEPQLDTEREDRDKDSPAGKGSRKERARLRLSVSLRGLAIGVVIVAAVAVAAVFAWLYFGDQQKLAAQARQADNGAHAEKIALDYAVNAAAMNYQDLNAWKVKLVAGTTPELKDKLTKAGDSMEQLLVPLQWTSTAQPLVAKVRSDTNGAYVVDCFVSVETKTVQAPDPLQSTATYSVTINSNDNWQISDVGGIGAVVQQK